MTIGELRMRGIELTLAGLGSLRIQCSRPVTDEERRLIVEHKASLLTELQQPKRLVFKEAWRQAAWDSWIDPFELQLPGELVVPASLPNNEEAIEACINSQRVWRRHNRDSARVQGHGYGKQ